MARAEASAAWAAVARLPGDRRRAVVLRFVEEMSTTEIAGRPGPVRGRRPGPPPPGAPSGRQRPRTRDAEPATSSPATTRPAPAAGVADDVQRARGDRGRGARHRPLPRGAAAGRRAARADDAPADPAARPVGAPRRPAPARRARPRAPFVPVRGTPRAAPRRGRRRDAPGRGVRRRRHPDPVPGAAARRRRPGGRAGEPRPGCDPRCRARPAAAAGDRVRRPGCRPAAQSTTTPSATRSRSRRPFLVGGAVTSAALSLAGAAFVAWRLTRGAPTDPMARAVRLARAARAGRDILPGGLA